MLKTPFKGVLLATCFAIHSMTSAMAVGPEDVALIKQTRDTYSQFARASTLPTHRDPHLATLIKTLIDHFAAESPYTWENLQIAIQTLQATHPELLAPLQAAVDHISTAIQGLLGVEETFDVELLTATAQTISQEITSVLNMANIQAALRPAPAASTSIIKPAPKKPLKASSTASSASAAPIDRAQLDAERAYRRLSAALAEAYQGSDKNIRRKAIHDMATFIFNRKLVEWLKQHHISAETLLALLESKYKNDGTGIQLVWAEIVAKLKKLKPENVTTLGALAQEIVALIEPHLEALMPQPAALPQTPIAPIPPPHLGGNVTESGNGTTQGSQNSRGFSVTLPLSALSHKKD